MRKLTRLRVAHARRRLVSLPLDERTRDALDWLADEIAEVGGEASVWLAQPGTQGQARALAETMTAAVVAEYAP